MWKQKCFLRRSTYRLVEFAPRRQKLSGESIIRVNGLKKEKYVTNKERVVAHKELCRVQSVVEVLALSLKEVVLQRNWD